MNQESYFIIQSKPLRRTHNAFDFRHMKVSSTLFLAKKIAVGGNFAHKRGAKKRSLETNSDVEAIGGDDDE
jgi:hypothetical protein